MTIYRPSAPLVFEDAVLARAPVNIALIKYWGKAACKRPDEVNLPAVPSLSLSLDGLYTDTLARFALDADADSVSLDGVALEGEELKRAVILLDALRAKLDIKAHFDISSYNAVPTAAGLASSASGMAALAGAAGRLAGLDPTHPKDAEVLSELARIGSGSASRSIYGGWVGWHGRAAYPLAPVDAMPVEVVVGVVSKARKAIGSRDGMKHTMATSPFYAAWVEQAHATFHEALEAVAHRERERLLLLMERSTWRMHASGMAADPPVCYWQAASLAALIAAPHWRAEGLRCGVTLDAGPNVKVFCAPEDADAIAARLMEIPGITHIIRARPGAGLSVRTLSLPADMPLPNPATLAGGADSHEGGSR